MIFFQSDDHKYVVNQNIDKQSLSNWEFQDIWGGSFF
jgi:hypothetical protein